METLTIELNTPKARKLIDDLVDLGIISLKAAVVTQEEKPADITKRIPGGLLRLSHLEKKPMVLPANFNDAVDDLTDYM